MWAGRDIEWTVAALDDEVWSAHLDFCVVEFAIRKSETCGDVFTILHRRMRPQKIAFFGVDAWPGRNQRRIPPYGFSTLASLPLLLLLILNCLAFALAASAAFCLFSVIIVYYS